MNINQFSRELLLARVCEMNNFFISLHYNTIIFPILNNFEIFHTTGLDDWKLIRRKSNILPQKIGNLPQKNQRRNKVSGIVYEFGFYFNVTEQELTSRRGIVNGI